MELGEQIRATLQKDGIGMARKTFGEENVANELKKDFGLVKEIFYREDISSFDACIFSYLPSEVTHFFEQEIIDFQVDRIMREQPDASREDVIASVKKDISTGVIRKEYTEKGGMYKDLYAGVDYAKAKYGKENVEAILQASPELKQNLQYFGRINETVVLKDTQVTETREDDISLVEYGKKSYQNFGRKIAAKLKETVSALKSRFLSKDKDKTEDLTNGR